MTETPRLWDEPRHQRRGPRARALGTTVAAMTAAGLVEKADTAVVDGARAAAALYDAALHDPDESRFVLARLAGEYRAWLELLRSLAGAGTGDQLTGLLRELSAPLGNATDPGPPDRR